MIDLKNTYIVNDRGELRDLYVSALAKTGVETEESDEHFLIYEPDDFPHMDTARLGWHNYNNSRKLNLSDFKTKKTRTEWVRVEDGIFDLRPDFECGELYNKVDDDKYTQIVSPLVLVAYLGCKAVYRKVEKEIDWRDELVTYLDKDPIYGAAMDERFREIDFNGMSEPDFIGMCHLVAGLTEKPE